MKYQVVILFLEYLIFHRLIVPGITSEVTQFLIFMYVHTMNSENLTFLFYAV